MSESPVPLPTLMKANQWYDAEGFHVCCHCANTHQVKCRVHEGKIQYQWREDASRTWENRLRQFGFRGAAIVTKFFMRRSYQQFLKKQDKDRVLPNEPSVEDFFSFYIGEPEKERTA
jgi:hypothetical protein